MQKCYADVIVDITSEKLDRVFQYRIPEEMQGTLEPGMVVEIPFGAGNRKIKGYVIGISAHCSCEPGKLKSIEKMITDSSNAQSRLIALAAWIRERYGSTMIQALKTVLPVKKKIRAREKKTVVLELDREAAMEKLAVFQKKHQTARARLLEALLEEPVMPCELITEKLNITAPVIKALSEQGIIRLKREILYRNPVARTETKDGGICLNEQQRNIVDTILREWEENPCGRYLIHGVTGSGKTEVYMELIAHAVSRGQQAIVLIPEIALTYQTVLRFYRRFGARVSVINSRLSAGERYDQFERARQGELDVMIGPRSALFTPFPNLGIIVMDEEHEPAYQSETTPRYHAREVALQRGIMEQAKVVLGSATPSLEAYYGAETGTYRLFRLTRRAKAAAMPRVEVVDLRRELREGNRSILSRALQERMTDELGAGHQVMLFLNRRGYAGFVSCRSCGYVVKCPHCDVSLSLHGNGQMICHYCGYSQPARSTCPECGSGFLRSFKAGTQQIEEEVKRLFPEYRTLRMDLDTTREKEGHSRILSAFANHEADILIGTQMIVKGHDFPEVTVMGILAADLSLHVPDFRASERTFQLLTQAAGRAGRADQPGYVAIQTYDPEHFSIQAAARQDYEAFYQKEMEYRLLAGYPPAGGLLAVHCVCRDEILLHTACDYLKQFILKAAGNCPVGVLGPAQESVAKIQDLYRMVIYVKHEKLPVLTAIKDRIEQYIMVNEGFRTVQVIYDIS